MRGGACAALFLAAGLVPPAVEAAATSALYDTHCSVCHQRGAVGAPGQYPRLAGRVAAIAGNPDGRAYIVSVVRNGLSGAIKVDGVRVAGLMPALPQLQGQELASILNYVTSLEPAPPRKPPRFSGAEVASLSKRVLASQQLLSERESLVSAGVIP